MSEIGGPDKQVDGLLVRFNVYLQQITVPQTYRIQIDDPGVSFSVSCQCINL